MSAVPFDRDSGYAGRMRLMITILVIATLVLIDAAWYRGYYVNEFALLIKWASFKMFGH
jgi:hypothetical protein